jgi:nucleolar protein 15
MGSKKSRAVEPDEERLDKPSKVPPTKRKKATVASTTTKKPVDDKPKPSIPKKDVQSKSKPVKSPLTVANSGGKSDPKPAGKKQKAVPEPVEAESEESEQEWVGFGGVDEESGEEDEEEGEDEDEEEDDGDTSEDELLHGLSSDDQDSSDEEVDLPGIDISKLPTIAKDDKIVKQKLEKAKRQPVCITFAYNSTFPRRLIFGFGVDRGSGCDLPRSGTSRVPRRTNEKLLHPVRRRHPTATITQQKGSLITHNSHPTPH